MEYFFGVVTGKVKQKLTTKESDEINEFMEGYFMYRIV
jgi:hypothetical protein